MSPVSLRDTQPDDLDFVLEAESDPENRPYVAQWTREAHQAALVDPAVRHWMVDNGLGERVGYMILRGIGGPSVELMRITIAEKGRGYGRAAVRLAMDRAFGELRAESMWLDVFHYNERARALYESEGFQVVGTRERVDAGLEPGEPLIVLEARPSPPG